MFCRQRKCHIGRAVRNWKVTVGLLDVVRGYGPQVECEVEEKQHF